MLRKGELVSWGDEDTRMFQKINEAIKKALVLKSLDFSKPFQLFSFAYFHTIVVVVLQNNYEGNEQLIVFFQQILAIKKIEMLYNGKEGLFIGQSSEKIHTLFSWR